MSCLINSGINKCKDYSIGGIKRLFITNKSWLNDYYFDLSDTNFSTITNFSMSNSTWYEFQIVKTFLSTTEELNISGQKKLFKKRLDATFIKLDATKRGVLQSLINFKSVVVILDNNNKWWVLGEDTGCIVQDYVATTSAIDGLSNYKIILKSDSKYQIRNIDSDYASQYIAGDDAPIECGCSTLINYNLSISADCTLIDLENCHLQ